MPVYISLLRGINVSGKKKIKMAALKAMFEDLGFEAVITYIQSGNIIFKTKKTKEALLEKKIKTAIEKTFGYNVPTLVLSRAELAKLEKENPYRKRDLAPNLLHFTLLATPPSSEKIQSVQAMEFPGEEFTITDRIVFLCLPNGYGRTKLNNNFFESKLKVQATTRNLKSINKILELSNE